MRSVPMVFLLILLWNRCCDGFGLVLGGVITVLLDLLGPFIWLLNPIVILPVGHSLAQP